jgi:EAL domain-containing protein (putative c-di-GMP-specific phosphodiesterase class I)
MAMYGVKRSGRNQVSVVELGRNRHADVFAMASELHVALEHRDLHLAYQPVFAASDRRLTGFEALCRWDHAERGTISPVDFIPVAEESGLMPALGSWVLDEACRQAVAWRSLLGDHLSMAVNVSGRQLAHPEFVTLVSDSLSTTGLRPEDLILELTESILLGEHANYESVLVDLKGLGVRLSIDDFGTGYSSLAYLRRFPVDQLKVDRGFVQDVAEHGDTRIIGAVVRLAHDLGLEVVAEGVETEDELSIVRKLECDSMQGFLLGYPLAPALVEETFAADHLLSTT